MVTYNCAHFYKLITLIIDYIKDRLIKLYTKSLNCHNKWTCIQRTFLDWRQMGWFIYWLYSFSTCIPDHIPIKISSLAEKCKLRNLKINKGSTKRHSYKFTCIHCIAKLIKYFQNQCALNMVEDWAESGGNNLPFCCKSWYPSS